MRKHTLSSSARQTTKSQQTADLALDADIDHLGASSARDKMARDQEPSAAASSSSMNPDTPMQSHQVAERYERIGRYRTQQIKNLPKFEAFQS